MSFLASSPPQLTSEQAATLTLWQLCNMSVKAVQTLMQRFHSASAALAASTQQWQSYGVHSSHVKRFAQHQHQHTSLLKTQLIQQIEHSLQQGVYQLLFLDDINYPKQLKQLADAPPVLFIRGNIKALAQAQLAIVGTRKPSVNAKHITEDFARVLAAEGIWITSGLADGIDKHAHMGALNQGCGRTVAVLGTGINLCYPKQNQGLFNAIIDQGGCVITEFLPDVPPNAHNFPRRNRLVSGLSLGVLVVEAALKSGSLITARLAAEQGKLVFAMPGHIYNTQAKGCHHLIREGAILVDSPAHIIEDINLPKSWHMQNLQEQLPATSPKTPVTDGVEPVSNAHDSGNQDNNTVVSSIQQQTGEATVNLAANLQQVLAHLDWIGQDMDELVATTQKDVATLTSELMQLELLGLVVQQGGRYLRCRPQ